MLNLVEIRRVFLLLDCTSFDGHICNILGKCLHKDYLDNSLHFLVSSHISSIKNFG